LIAPPLRPKYLFSMNASVKSCLSLLLLAVAALVAGCSTQTPTDSSIPWSRPANWENQVPGMGSGNMH
jgi:hypothetical protein